MSDDFNYVKEYVKANLEYSLKRDGVDPALASQILQNFGDGIDPEKVSYSPQDITEIANKLYERWKKEGLGKEHGSSFPGEKDKNPSDEEFGLGEDAFAEEKDVGAGKNLLKKIEHGSFLMTFLIPARRIKMTK